MGFSLPAAIGASFGIKDRPIICICGDGGLQMNIQELITAVVHSVPIKIFVINNSTLGMVRQWQELFYGKKYSQTDLSSQNPDFVKVAQAFGMDAFSANNPENVDDMLNRAFEINNKPVLVEFKVEKEDNVFPMVPSGASVSEMMIDEQQSAKVG
jgi:acetolactate synthase-1/2/3 large subunit